jgi:hypothetical protein
MLAHKSLIEILNKCPNLDSCDSPDIVGKGERDFPKVRITEKLGDT